MEIFENFLINEGLKSLEKVISDYEKRFEKAKKDNEKDRIERDIIDLKAILKNLEKEKYETAYEFYSKLDTIVREDIPKDIVKLMKSNK